MEVYIDLMDEHNRPTKATGRVDLYLLESKDAWMETNPSIDYLNEKSVFKSAYQIEFDNFFKEGHFRILAKNKNDGLIYAKRDSAGFVTAGTEHGGSSSRLFVIIHTENNKVLHGDCIISWGENLF